MKKYFPGFKHAFAGLTHVLKSQRNAWIHGIATVLAISLAILLQLSMVEIAIIIILIGIVWTAEILNTSIEAIVDLTSPEQHPLAKIAKDTAAAAVLVSAIISVIVAVLFLGPPLFNIAKSFFRN